MSFVQRTHGPTNLELGQKELFNWGLISDIDSQ